MIFKQSLLSNIFVFIVAGICLYGCVGLEKSISFSGKWKETLESEISSNKEESFHNIVTDGKRFKIESSGVQTGSCVKIYDGTWLYTKYTYNTAEAGAIRKDNTSNFSKVELSELNAGPYRFWDKKSATLGHSGPGGMVAGRETMLYQLALNRPDGKITSQYWVDNKTKVVLKSIYAVYSSQVEAMVTKQTCECQEINYTDIKDEVFVAQ